MAENLAADRPSALAHETRVVLRVGPLTTNSRWRAAPPGVKPTRWRARTKFRDNDGVTRDVERYGPTKAKAETALKVALSERRASTSSEVMRPNMSVADAGRFWLEQIDRPDSNLSASSRSQYRSAFDRCVTGSRIIGLSLREVNSVPILERWQQEIADTRGSGSAKTARSVMSSILGLAVRYQVLEYNAMREVRTARAKTPRPSLRDPARAFSREDRDLVLKFADNSPAAVHADIADLAWFLAGTGVRIGEALAQSWSDVDLEAGTVYVRGTKTRAQRAAPLDARVANRAPDRSGAAPVDRRPPLPFARAAPRTDCRKPRDLRNVNRELRMLLDEAGFPWATSHTFRRTVATLLDEAGQPLVLAANQLGHKDPAMTARVYLGRKGDLSAAAAVL